MGGEDRQVDGKRPGGRGSVFASRNGGRNGTRRRVREGSWKIWNLNGITENPLNDLLPEPG